MAAVRQVGTEKRKLTRDMARQIEDEVSATEKKTSERKASAQRTKAQRTKVKR